MNASDPRTARHDSPSREILQALGVPAPVATPVHWFLRQLSSWIRAAFYGLMAGLVFFGVNFLLRGGTTATNTHEQRLYDSHSIDAWNNTVRWKSILPAEWLDNYSQVNLTLYQGLPDTIVAASQSLDRIAKLIPVSGIEPQTTLLELSQLATTEHEAVERAYMNVAVSAHQVAITWPTRAVSLVDRLIEHNKQLHNNNNHWIPFLQAFTSRPIDSAMRLALQGYITDVLHDLGKLRDVLQLFLHALEDERAATEALGTELRIRWYEYKTEVDSYRRKNFVIQQWQSDTIQRLCQKGTHIVEMGTEYQSALLPVKELAKLVDLTITALMEVDRSLGDTVAKSQERGVDVRGLSAIAFSLSKAALQATWWPASGGPRRVPGVESLVGGHVVSQEPGGEL